MKMLEASCGIVRYEDSENGTVKMELLRDEDAVCCEQNASYEDDAQSCLGETRVCCVLVRGEECFYSFVTEFWKITHMGAHEVIR